MLAKAPKAVLAGPGVVVDATEPRATGSLGAKLKIVTLLGVIFSALLGYQNCSVDNSLSTPGALSASCSPTDATLNQFQPVMVTYLQNTGSLPSPSTRKACGSCHADQGNSAALRMYIDPLDPNSDPTVTQRNFCVLKAISGSTIESKVLGQSPHSGGTYSTADIQPLLDFLQSNL